MNRSEIRKSLKSKIDWALNNPTRHQNPHVLEALVYHFTLEWLKVSFETTESDFKDSYDLFIDKNFGAQSWPNLAGFLGQRRRNPLEVSKELASHLKIFVKEIYQQEFEKINGACPTRRTSKIYNSFSSPKKPSKDVQIKIFKKP